MRTNLFTSGRRLLLVALAAFATADFSRSYAEPATPLDTDINADGLGFTGTDPFAYGSGFGQDADASLNGNDFLVQSMIGPAGGNTGAGISIPVSNGENGIDQTFDGTNNTDINDDVPNATAANSVFTTIGNVSGKLENGNVIRYSMWVREDPNNPMTLAPQIEPVFKLEFWKEALSTFADTNPGAQPLYGDKVFDTDQHFGEGVWIDVDNSGTVIDAAAAGEGRIRTVSTDEWTLIEVQHVVDDSNWFGIADDLYTVADIEEVRGVMFWGDFTQANLTDAGSLWFDNARMEVFKDLASVTPNDSPNPSLSEGGVAGDFDNDQDVDGADLAAWKGAFSATNDGGDADNDGDTDGADFLVWQRNFTGQPAVAAIPEPASAGIALVSIAAMLCVRRKS